MSSSAAAWASTRGEKWRANAAVMEATLRPLDEPLIGALQLAGRARIADIGCGAGGTSLAVQRRAPSGSVVHGFDISASLIEYARARTLEAGLPVVFELADVATAPLPAVRYDRLYSRLGVMFFDDPTAAFARLRSWLVPAGRCTFVVWARPEDNPWLGTVRAAVEKVIEVPWQDPNGPGLFRYAAEGALPALLSQAGFRDIETREWRGALPVGGGLPAAAAANVALDAFSSFAELLAEAGAGKRDQVAEDLTTAFRRHERDGVVQIAAAVHVVSATTSAD